MRSNNRSGPPLRQPSLAAAIRLGKMP